MANNSISLVNLDFDTLKQNLKLYLKSQPQFTDFDFDGSNMSVLLDILTYNTHLNAFYLNMAVSEAFLDSAQVRNSVVSRAKELNYTPRSYRSSEAVIDIQFNQSNLSIFEIPFGTKFTGKASNKTYTYTTNESITLYPSGGYFTANNLSLYEGVFVTDIYTVDTSIEAQRFILSNDTVDTNSLTVIVSEDAGQTNTTYTKAESLYNLNANSTVYFVQATEGSFYEIVFGDGIIGRKPLNNAQVFANYRITSGSDSNGSTNFTLDDNLSSYNGAGGTITATITTLQPGLGGANAESIESIRYNAPRHYQTQGRAITTADYRSLVLSNFPDVKTMNVYGGESIANSVQFGKVFISPATFSGDPLSDNAKTDIELFLKDRCTLGVMPQVVNPDYLYLIVTSKVKYDPDNTIESPSDIKNIVSNAILTYNEDNLVDFNTEFKFSRLEAAINSSENSISSNETTIIMRKDLNPDLDTDSYIDVQYRNKIVPGSFYSTVFLSNGLQYQFTDYNPLNNTFIINQISNGRVSITNSSNLVYLKDVTNPGYETYTAAGRIDYENGSIDLNAISINGFVNNTKIEFYAEPANQDIMAKSNDLIQIDMAAVNITVQSI